MELKRRKGRWSRYGWPACAIAGLGALAVAAWLVGGVNGQGSALTPPDRYRFELTAAEDPLLALEREIAFYRQRMDLDPQGGLDLAALADAYLRMGKLSGGTGWYLSAEQAARRSLANLPAYNDGPLLTLVSLAEAKHRFDEAVALALRVLASDPTHPGARALLVTAWLGKGEGARALVAADALVEIVPTSGAFALRALVQVSRGRDEVALADFERALRLEAPGDPYGSAWTRTVLGRFHAQRGRHALAQAYFQEALRILPKYPLALIQLAALETQRGQYGLARRHYDEVFDVSQSNGSAHTFDHAVLRGVARLRVLQGDPSGADALRQRAETLLRQHVDLSFGHRRELAQLLLERGRGQDVAEALALMEAEIAVRRDAETLETLAWALAEAGRLEEAKKALDEALSTGIQHVRLLYRAGAIERALGRPAQASALFEQAQRLDPMFAAHAHLWGIDP